MMGLVKEWLLSVTGAAILAALADSLMPEGSAKRVGQLVCGMVLLIAVLKPLGNIEVTEFSTTWVYDELQIKQQLQEGANIRMKSIIEEKLSAYSMDKAAELGLDCEAKVFCSRNEDGTFLPDRIEISGVMGHEEQETLVAFMEEELGVEHTKILFREAAS